MRFRKLLTGKGASFPSVLCSDGPPIDTFGLTRTHTDRPIALYEYQPDRKAKHLEAFLQGFQGYPHADGYEGCHKLPDDIAVVGCWAFLLRKFDEALKVLPSRAKKQSRP